MLRIAICEDDPLPTEAIMALLAKYQTVRPGVELHASCYGSGYDLMCHFEAGRIFDLFLLDILMPGLSGIELARELRMRGEDAPFVFLTASADYALDAFNVQATQYILKPVKEQALFSVLDKIVSTQQRKIESFFLVSTPGRMVKVPLSSIIFVESSGRALQIYLTDGRKLSSKTIRVPFAEAVAPLLQDKRFLYAHKSFILNMAMVEEITGNSFIMKGGSAVPVPKYKYADAKDKYLEYLSMCGIERTAFNTVSH